MMTSTTFKRTFAVILAALLFAAVAQSKESVYLKSGDEYECSVTGISGGALQVTHKGSQRAFELGELQRIEFQRERLYDDVDTADALAQASPVFAEALALETADLKSRYPQAGRLVIRDDMVVTLSPDGKYSVERTLVWRILEQRAADSSFRAIYFFPEIDDVKVVFGITVGPDGEIARVSDGAMKTEAVYPSFPEYNHRRRLRFAMKNPVPGATLFLKTVKTGVATELMPLVLDKVFWGGEPALSRTVKLVADEESRGRTAVLTANGLEDGESGTLWSTTETPKIFPEPMMPPYSSFAPRLVLAFPVASWDELAGEFAAQLDSSPISSPEGTTARDVYDRVRKNVRVVSVPQDALPVPPSPPAVVLERGYGNRAEKALLLEALLDGLGVDASTVLVRGRGAGTLEPSVPRMAGFPQAVVRFTGDEGETMYLQPDATKRAFGELGGNVQGGSGLDIRTGELITIPVKEAVYEESVRTVTVMLDGDGNAVVEENLTFKGAEARNVRSLGDMTEEELHKWAAMYAGSQLPGVELIDFSHSDFEKMNEVEAIKVKYSIPNLAQVSGDYLLMRLPNAEYSPAAVGRTAREYDLFWPRREREEVWFVINAPEGYSLYAAGNRAERSGEGWSMFSGTAPHPQAPGSVAFSETWIREGLTAPAADYEAYREALIMRGILRNEMIVFEKSS